MEQNWSYQKKFQNGEVILNTGMVLGYKKSSTGEYVIAEDEAETVLRIYREYLAGTFKAHINSGDKMDISDAVVLRQLTDRIVVYDDRLEIHLRIGVVLEQKYE